MVGKANSRIHSIVPKTESPPRASQLVEKLRNILHRLMGPNNAKTSSEIMKMLGYNPTATNQPLRAAAKVLLEEGIPLVAGNKGFYIALNREQLGKYKDNLEQRLAGIARDIQLITKIQLQEDIHMHLPKHEPVQHSIF